MDAADTTADSANSDQADCQAHTADSDSADSTYTAAYSADSAADSTYTTTYSANAAADSADIERDLGRIVELLMPGQTQ